MFHFPFGGSSGGAREDGVLRRERMNLRIFWLRAARLLLSSSIVDTKHLSQSSAADASLTKVKSKKLPQKQGRQLTLLLIIDWFL